ncbi:hypothetical protein D3C85_1825640 [compost metagenome]
MVVNPLILTGTGILVTRTKLKPNVLANQFRFSYQLNSRRVIAFILSERDELF